LILPPGQILRGKMTRQPCITWIRGAGSTPAFAAFKSAGFVVLPAAPEEAVRQVAELRPDAAVIEESPLSAAALKLCERVAVVTQAPILLLSETPDEDAMVRAFAAGATDYVVMPQDTEVLGARLRAALRLAGVEVTANEADELRVGDIELSLQEQRAVHRGKELHLTPTEFALLLALARAGGQPVPHGTLIASVWGPEYVESRNYLRLYIRYLREKIEDNPEEPSVVMNEWGVGYFLNDRSRAAA
jgi:two-component system KDP operon response regulator KdpE